MAYSKDNNYAKGKTDNGRPPTFKTPKSLELKCLSFFEYCIDNSVKPTITGLTLYVGFSSRASWDDYKARDGFSYIVKRAKLTVENSYEMSATTFDMFALKNMGWKDKTETDLTTGGDKINLTPISFVSTKDK